MKMYGVFVGGTRGGKFAITPNKRAAVRLAKKERGSVRVILDAPNDRAVWDAPTFWAVSRPLEDFSK